MYGTNGGEWSGQDSLPSDHTFRRTIRLLFVEVARLTDLKLGLHGPGSEQPAYRLIADVALEGEDGMKRTSLFRLLGHRMNAADGRLSGFGVKFLHGPYVPLW